MLERMIGRNVEIIYMDRQGRITQRRVQVRSVRGGLLRGYCEASGGPRTFRIANILAAVPVLRRSG